MPKAWKSAYRENWLPSKNAGRFGYLQSVLDRLNQLLPDDLILCKEKSEQEETQAETNSGELKNRKEETGKRC